MNFREPVDHRRSAVEYERDGPPYDGGVGGSPVDPGLQEVGPSPHGDVVQDTGRNVAECAGAVFQHP